jgi:hypothetical protein
MLRERDIAVSEVQSKAKPSSLAMSSSARHSSTSFIESRTLPSPMSGVWSDTAIDLPSSKPAITSKMRCLESPTGTLCMPDPKRSSDGDNRRRPLQTACLFAGQRDDLAGDYCKANGGSMGDTGRFFSVAYSGRPPLYAG